MRLVDLLQCFTPLAEECTLTSMSRRVDLYLVHSTFTSVQVFLPGTRTLSVQRKCYGSLPFFKKTQGSRGDIDAENSKEKKPFSYSSFSNNVFAFHKFNITSNDRWTHRFSIVLVLSRCSTACY